MADLFKKQIFLHLATGEMIISHIFLEVEKN